MKACPHAKDASTCATCYDPLASATADHALMVEYQEEVNEALTSEEIVWIQPKGR